MGDPSDRILLGELEFEARVGILPGESDQPQPLGAELEIRIDLSAAAASGRVDDGFDYRLIPELLGETAAAGPYGLLETLAARLAQAILRQDKVDSVRVKLWKQRPPLGDAFGRVAVELFRRGSEG